MRKEKRSIFHNVDAAGLQFSSTIPICSQAFDREGCWQMNE